MLASLLATGQVRLVHDFNNDADSAFASAPVFLTPFKDRGIIYSSNHATKGRELWWSEGSRSTTSMIIDINPVGGSFPSNPRSYLHGIPDQGNFRPLCVLNDRVYFVANDGTRGFELWQSDGTAEGTSLLKDINPGPMSSFIIEMTVVGDAIYFTADDGVAGPELWKTDGSAEGTSIVLDINPGPEGSSPHSLTRIGSSLAFAANNGVAGNEPWISDGTSEGTTILFDIEPGQPGIGDINFTGNTSHLFFSTGQSVWKSDGTSAGTGIYKSGSDFVLHTYFEGNLYFSRSDLAGMVFATDGITENFYKMFDPSPDHVYGTIYCDVVDNQLFFACGFADLASIIYNWGPHINEEFNIYNFNVGTGQFETFAEYLFTNNYYNHEGSTAVINILKVQSGDHYFTINNGGIHQILRKTADGSYNDVPVFGNHYGSNVAIVGNKLFLSRFPFSDPELNVLEGNVSAQISNAYANKSSNIGTLFPFMNEVFFQTSDYPNTLNWRSDGVSTISTNFDVSNPVVFKNKMYTIRSGNDDTEVWTWDGENSVKLISLEAGEMFPTEDLMFFYVFGATGRELWKTDGTLAGTVFVIDVQPTGPSATLNGEFFFIGYDDFGKNEFWKSDGTAAGTIKVKEGAIEYASKILRFKDELYLDGAGMWKTDGTSAGTIELLSTAVTVDLFVASSDHVFYGVRQQGAEFDIYSFDGTTHALLATKEIRSFTALNNNVILFATGTELWATDGTTDGTVMIYEFQLQEDVSYGHALTAVDGLAYFAGSDFKHGIEIWTSDGTKDGTRLYIDLYPGTESSNPGNFCPLKDELLFVAKTGETGYELWATVKDTREPTAVVEEVAGTSAYPNPSKGEVIIQSKDGVKDVACFAPDGREIPVHIQERNFEKWRIHIQCTGLTIFRISTLSGIVFKRVIFH